MNGISVSLAMLFLKGIPEGLLVTWAIHTFTLSKMNVKQYLLLSLIYISATYLIRFLPITLGVNTILSLFVLIFAYQVVHRVGLSKVIRAMISSIIILVLIALSELLNVLLLTMMYGRTRAEELFTSSNGLTQSLYSIPSTVFLAIFVTCAYFIIRYFTVRKLKNGKTREEIGQ